jgi:DNA-binding PucR family transcriptional regulator
LDPKQIVSVMRARKLVILSTLDDKLQLAALLEATADRMAEVVPGCEVIFAVGDRISASIDIPAVYQECLLALEARRHLHVTERVIHLSSLGAFRLILSAASSEDAARLAENVIKPLLAQDARTGGSLLETYRIFLRHDSRVGSTARALSVHSHTVQYRLHKIQDLTGLNPRRSEDRLTLELALRVHDLVLAASRTGTPSIPSSGAD